MKVVRHNEQIRYNNAANLPKGLQPTDPEKYNKSINIASMFDLAFMEVFGLNSEEYDYIAEFATEEDIKQIYSVFDGDDTSFSNKRKTLEVINKYKKLVYEQR